MLRQLPILILVLLSLPTRAEVTLPDLFTDHMVLQRQQAIPVWGTASKGERVSVSFGDQVREAVADGNGQWRVALDPREASSTPAELRVTGENTIVLTDVLVGEVWLLTGQSNMQWRLLESAGGDSTIAAADYPEIRLFNVSRGVSFGREAGKLAVWKPCTPESVADFSGIGYFFGLDLYRRLGIPVGLINSSYGGSQAEAWTPREDLAASPELLPTIEREQEWEAARPRVQREYARAVADWEKNPEGSRRPRVPDALRDYRIAGSIYGNMIEPLIPFAIRGAAWYQGESNEERAEQYELLLTTMIRAWRREWGQGDFPFAIVQLPNFRATSEQPEDAAWSHLRDRQRRVAAAGDDVGLVVTIDVGEADDIHPTNKRDVGLRLSRWAASEVYGGAELAGGPVFTDAEFGDGQAVIRFDRVGEGLRTNDDGPPQEFAISGSDGVWVWAQAEIVGPDRIVVRSPEVPEPVAVRYAFNNNPEQPNLTNETGVPAGPFRTDDRPGPTHGKR